MKNISYLSNPYEFFVDFIAEKIFDNQQRQEYRKINECCGNCFLFAKKNDLNEADKYFEEGMFLFESAQNKHWISALCMPNISYYTYKTKNYERSINHTNEIITSLKYLQKNNYQYLFFSEIQQHHNISRIYLSMNEVSLAIDRCIYGLSAIVEHAKSFQSDHMIYGVSELELYGISQYAMTIQVLAETCDKLIFCNKNDSAKVQQWLEGFMKQLLALDFSSISPDPRYKAIDKFIKIMDEILTNDGEFQEHVLLFAKDQYMDKALLKVLFKYINSTVTAA